MKRIVLIIFSVVVCSIYATAQSKKVGNRKNKIVKYKFTKPINSKDTMLPSVRKELEMEPIVGPPEPPPPPLFNSTGKPLLTPDVQAQFKGGTTALMDFISRNMVYPEAAQESGLEADVNVQFIVTVTGNIKDVKIKSVPNPMFDKEALRIVRLMPKWQPATLKGKPVSYFFSMPITFRLEE